MPPFGGFVSEWFTFEALLQGFRLTRRVARSCSWRSPPPCSPSPPASACSPSPSSSAASSSAAPAPRSPTSASPAPAAGVLALAARRPLPRRRRPLGDPLDRPRPPRDRSASTRPAATIHFPLVLGPVYRNFSVLAPTWLAIGIPAFAVTSALLVRLLLRPPVRRAPSGSPAPHPTSRSCSTRPTATPTRSGSSSRSALPLPPHPRTDPRHPADSSSRCAPASRRRSRPTSTARSHEPRLALSDHARRLQSGRSAPTCSTSSIVLIAALALIPALHNR